MIEQDIGDDDPVPLAVAARIFFPHGNMKVSSLRNEARKGRLVIEKIANRQFVTRRGINAMRKLCRMPVPVPPSPTVEPKVEAFDSVAHTREIARRIRKGEPMPGEARKTAQIKRFPPAK